MNIKVLVQLKEYTLIKDNLTGYVWLYSYKKPIAWWDDKGLHVSNKTMSNMSKMHIATFKDYIRGFIL